MEGPATQPPRAPCPPPPPAGWPHWAAAPMIELCTGDVLLTGMTIGTGDRGDIGERVFPPLLNNTGGTEGGGATELGVGGE